MLTWLSSSFKYLPIFFFNDEGNSIFFNNKQFLKAFDPIVFTDEGIEIISIDLQPSQNDDPIDATVEGESNFTFTNFKQFKKAPSQISVTEEGIEISYNDEQPLNAYSPIEKEEVNSSFLPSVSKFNWKSELQPLKAFSQISFKK